MNLTFFFWDSIGLKKLKFHLEWNFNFFPEILSFKKGLSSSWNETLTFLGWISPLFWDSIGLEKLKFHLEWNFNFIFGESNLFFWDSIGLKKLRFHLE